MIDSDSAARPGPQAPTRAEAAQTVCSDSVEALCIFYFEVRSYVDEIFYFAVRFADNPNFDAVLPVSI